LKAVSYKSALETVEKLQIKLADFAKNHRKEIQDDPAFRQKFLQMCGPLGVDPLTSPKSFWAKALGVGMGDFYYELAVKVAEVCFATRSRNGGIIALTEVHESLNKNRKKAYALADIPIAIQKLAKLGGGFRIVKVGKSEMIVSVPTELDQDHMEVMELAQDGEGCVTEDDVMQKLKWSKDRAARAITLLLQEGMAWKDDYLGISFYWFPSIWKEQFSFDS
jgi:ESCRT-II complex subunit VPS22